ncbi:hypothetical protein [Paracnuella aquatica]|uniref:hypothetical protein n=1 Tax=Paracnuella aquatica TaxID=2268757 RepID=UPI000F50114A|nr:hypothetical protein [Paracnuella aquatica]RPD43448.1 hypothetical protein DRJ53_20140 [Paracnuella aquatica]
MNAFDWIEGMLVYEQTELVFQLIDPLWQSDELIHVNNFYALNTENNNVYLSGQELLDTRQKLIARRDLLQSALKQYLKKQIEDVSAAFDQKFQDRVVGVTNHLRTLTTRLEGFDKSVLMYGDFLHWFLIKRIRNSGYLFGLLKANGQPLVHYKGNSWWGVPKPNLFFEPYEHLRNQLSDLQLLDPSNETISVFQAFCRTVAKPKARNDRVQKESSNKRKFMITLDCSLKELTPITYKSGINKERLFERAIRMDIPNVFVRYIEDGNPYK